VAVRRKRERREFFRDPPHATQCGIDVALARVALTNASFAEDSNR